MTEVLKNKTDCELNQEKISTLEEIYENAINKYDDSSFKDSNVWDKDKYQQQVRNLVKLGFELETQSHAMYLALHEIKKENIEIL